MHLESLESRELFSLSSMEELRLNFDFAALRLSAATLRSDAATNLKKVAKDLKSLPTSSGNADLFAKLKTDVANFVVHMQADARDVITATKAGVRAYKTTVSFARKHPSDSPAQTAASDALFAVPAAGTTERQKLTTDANSAVQTFTNDIAALVSAHPASTSLGNDLGTLDRAISYNRFNSASAITQQQTTTLAADLQSYAIANGLIID